ncbi:MAG: DUF4494 domain-containing protein [Bacteroidales bacterium]|nr:DUF4494 domain-containing protein [Candidatus Physcousia equi]
MWFTCKIKFNKVSEEGLMTKVQETYLLDALSFTEAEARFLEEMAPFMNDEFEITDIKKTRVSELFTSVDSLADKWYKAVVALITLDEKSGKEKRTNCPMYVQAANITDALHNLHAGMQGSLSDYVVVSLAETPILDVYPVKLDTETNENPA